MPKRLMWVLLVLLCGSLFIYYHKPVGVFVRWVSSCGAYPFLKVYKNVGVYVNGYEAWLLSKKNMASRIAYLEKERSELLAELIECKALISYQDEIRELDVFRKKNAAYCQKCIVQVLAIHQNDDEHYALVEGGMNNGVALDMLAPHKNHLVGRVVEVFSRYSKVRLISDKRIHVACYCARTKAKGIYTGGNQEEATLKFVDHMQHIRLDDLVISSGKGLIYPRGLCLGKIVHFVKKDVDYEITLKPLIDLATLDYCLLI